ncbi:hypothetical protein PR048_008407 [Dryococelus australis]|uniref:Uncharacterized protein n=1 Tax=Dryococelus australis TaxID=614101 RepID=A0ABQ9HX13_9NEOP|nr:hypothetical protein PR048_008407 [Dryococelus australis]
MAGPAANGKLFNVMQADLKKDFGCTLIVPLFTPQIIVLNVAIGQHRGTLEDFWQALTGYLKILQLREDYLNISLTKKLQGKFCKHSWLENVPAAERALGMWVGKGNLSKIKCKSFGIVEEACKDVLMSVKLNVFLSVVKLLQPFVKKYLGDLPLLPFLAVNPRNIVVSCLNNFNIMNNEYILKITPPYKVSLFDFKDKKCLLSLSKVSLGSVPDEIVELIHKSEVTERQRH